MIPLKGQKIKDNPKDKVFQARIDAETYTKLKKTAETLSITKSEVVRRGIEHEYRKATKK